MLDWLGFGGYCLPKDISALESFSKNIFSKNYFKSIISINNNIIDCIYIKLNQN